MAAVTDFRPYCLFPDRKTWRQDYLPTRHLASLQRCSERSSASFVEAQAEQEVVGMGDVKYGADVFENEHAVVIFPGNSGKTLLKMKGLFGQTTGPAQFVFEQGNRLNAA